MIFFVTLDFLETIFKNYLNIEGVRHGKVSVLVYKNKSYVLTGFSHKEHCLNCITAMEVTPVNKYTGSIKALPQELHDIEIILGNRKPGYNGMIVIINNIKYVMMEPIVSFVKASDKTHQEELIF